MPLLQKESPLRHSPVLTAAFIGLMAAAPALAARPSSGPGSRSCALARSNYISINASLVQLESAYTRCLAERRPSCTSEENAVAMARYKLQLAQSYVHVHCN